VDIIIFKIINLNPINFKIIKFNQMQKLGDSLTQYPEGKEYYQVDPLNTPRELAKYWGPTPSGLLESGYYTNSTPPIYSQQPNMYFVQTVESMFKEEERNGWFNGVFPQVISTSKKELITEICMNRFMAQKSAPGSPTLFTTSKLSTYMNSQEWYGSGFQVPWMFFASPQGVREYNFKLATLAKSLTLSSKFILYNVMTSMPEPYLEWVLENGIDDEKKQFRMLMKRKKFFWNIIGDNFALEKIEEKFNDEEATAGQVKSNVMISHPRVDTLRRNESNYRNDSIGQYKGQFTEGVQNKPQAEVRISRVGDSKVVFQEKIGIGGNVTYQPLEGLSTIGEHYVCANAYHYYPYDHNHNARVLEIHNAVTDKTHCIPFSEALKEAYTHNTQLGVLPWNEYNKTKKNYLGLLNEKFDTKDKTYSAFSAKTLHNYFRIKANKKESDENEIQYNILKDTDVPTVLTDVVLNSTNTPSLVQNQLPPTTTNNWFLLRAACADSKVSPNLILFYNYIKTIIQCYTNLHGSKDHGIKDFELSDDDIKFGDKKDVYLLIYFALDGQNTIDAITTKKQIVLPLTLSDCDKIFVTKSATINNPASTLIKFLTTCGYYDMVNKTSPLFYKIALLLWCTIRVEPGLPTQIIMAENGIECGANTMACRMNMTYNTANIYRVKDKGESFKRLKGFPNAKIYDDNHAELHNVEMREMQGVRTVDRKGYSIARNVAILDYQCGEGVKPTKDPKSLFAGKEHPISSFKDKLCDM
jgi:hypothetical protein